MEINCSSVQLTSIKESLLLCACGETALAASLVCVLVKAQLVVSVLAQEYMKLLTNQHKLRGYQHISCPGKPIDAEDDDDDDGVGDGDGDGEDEADGEEDGNPADGTKSAAKNGPGVPEENGEEEDDEEDPDDDDGDSDDDDDDADDDEDDNDGEEDGNEGEEEEDEDEEEEEEEDEEEEEEEEEALHPPKKRKK